VAERRDLDFTYSLIDRLFRLSLGEQADFSGAKFDGDFALTLEQAQRRKHEFVWDELRLAPGQRVLDMGCGWGALLHFLRARGVEGVGLTLARGQWRSCRRRGLQVHLMDCRYVTREALGSFDAVASLGAFEHFCSPDDFRAGLQATIYRRFFRGASHVLAPGGRLYLQTMVFGRRQIPADAVDVNAPRGSDGWVIGLLSKTFPGSWLPSGAEQVERAAQPAFRLVHRESGRLDYIETIAQWRRRFARMSLRKALVYATLVPRYLASVEFRQAFASGVSANTLAFERELVDHYRMVFEKVQDE
jgi:cyclopropane-fatty-acyl-phospholipid synthase